MNIKTGKILDSLAKRARYEDKNYEKIPHEKRMLAITPDTGIFYNSVIRATRAKRILEIGLSVGYSTIWFAEALPNNGKIISIEQNPDKIVWQGLSSNPNAIHLLEANQDEIEINWTLLSQNPNAIPLLEANQNRIDWVILSSNPNAIHLLEKNPSFAWLATSNLVFQCSSSCSSEIFDGLFSDNSKLRRSSLRYPRVKR